jgi:hypothetical protein
VIDFINVRLKDAHENNKMPTADTDTIDFKETFARLSASLDEMKRDLIWWMFVLFVPLLMLILGLYIIE